MQPVMTQYGELIPQHTTDDLRKKEILPATFHKEGTPKSLPLEQQTTITTPVGATPVELVTFHKNGILNRVFPLNGKLSGYWSEEDEMGLAKPIALRTPAGTIAARVISLSFYKNEGLRSVTFWPGETVTVETPLGKMEARIGVSFDEKGAVSSLEPASPIVVKTSVGDISAYDSDAVGVNGDANSLGLDSAGTITRVRTTLTSLVATSATGETTIFSPHYRESLCSESEKEIEPLGIEFGPDSVTIKKTPLSSGIVIPLNKYTIFTKPFLPQLVINPTTVHCSI